MKRELALEFARVTEAAALAAYKWVGRGNKEAADQAAVDAMRTMLNRIAIDGEIVIGEGEIDEAPMLYIGEKVGRAYHIVIVILWIIEDNKNFHYSEYNFWQYRMSKVSFLNSITIDLAKKCFFTWFSICIFIGFICAVEHCDVSNLFMIYMYLIRFFSLLFEIIFLRTIFQILYKKEFFVYLQFLFLILMTFLDNYSKTNLVTMSSNSVFEGIYFCIIIVTSVLSY